MTKLLPAISWPQAAALAALVTGAVLVAIFAPPDVRIPFAGVFVALAGWLRVRQ